MYFREFQGIFRVFQGVLPYALSRFALWTLPKPCSDHFLRKFLRFSCVATLQTSRRASPVIAKNYERNGLVPLTGEVRAYGL